ncbi:hypothetical protein [Streptomyces dubilierae]|uniref:MarR family transcriptional regulator n=1 Tax=Streptomyces dubilierae TaxID=3075533 RepID=A0ABU2PAU0_9ACTN|nr:hypothetical protein [Streptomyces sp. DSM 41921]MDT0389276.1 hypothetical protein [Streptomyces sp. DSM 41921]
MFHRPATDSWQAAAESPHRAPVLHAVGEMTRTLRARGEEATVAVWGPKDGAWHRYDAPARQTAAPRPGPAAAPGEPTVLAQRMTGRRHQVLLAGLHEAGLYELTPEDDTAVRALVDGLDEGAVRRVAHWLATAAGTRRPNRPV